MATIYAGQQVTAALLSPGDWQPITFANSWANQIGKVSCRYRLWQLLNTVELIGWINHGSTSGTSIINSAVSSAYQPASEQMIPATVIAATNAFASTTEMPILDIGTTGVFTLIALPAATTQVAFHGFYSLDA